MLIVIIGIIITAMMITHSLSSSYATINSTDNINAPLSSQIKDLFENPFFAPDYTCLFDAYQLHCIPGEQQECPVGFGQNEDYTCFPIHRGGCPDGYHSEEDDETGQCYPDTQPCWPGQVRNHTDPNDRSCKNERIVCDERNYNMTGCVRKADWPDASCLTNPSFEKCNVLPFNTCPDEFVVMNSQNFSSAKCVPEDRDQHQNEERYRQVHDPNRCASGYELYVSPNSNIWSTGGPIGNCNKID